MILPLAIGNESNISISSFLIREYVIKGNRVVMDTIVRKKHHKVAINSN